MGRRDSPLKEVNNRHLGPAECVCSLLFRRNTAGDAGLEGVAVYSEKVQPLLKVILRLGAHGQFSRLNHFLVLCEEGAPYPRKEDVLRLGKQADQLFRYVPPFQSFGPILGSRRGNYYFQEPVCTESPRKPMAKFQFERLKGQFVQGPILIVVVAGFYNQGHGVRTMPKGGKCCSPRSIVTIFRQSFVFEVGVRLERLIKLSWVAPGIIIWHVQSIEPHPAMERRSGNFPEDWERSTYQGFWALR